MTKCVKPLARKIVKARIVCVKIVRCSAMALKSFGIHGIHHTDYKSARGKLSAFGLAIKELEKDTL